MTEKLINCNFKYFLLPICKLQLPANIILLLKKISFFCIRTFRACWWNDFCDFFLVLLYLILKCIMFQAFSEAYSVLENELMCIPDYGDTCSRPPYRLLPKIIPSIDVL